MTRTSVSANNVCVGLDPNIEKFPSIAFQACNTTRERCLQDAEQAAQVVHWYGNQVLVAIQKSKSTVKHIKFQESWFEAIGSKGMAVLETLLETARSLDIHTIIDAKRGDFLETNKGYAQAWLSRGSPLAGDALTIHPWMGIDALIPIFDIAKEAGRQLYVVVRTSNPEGDLIQKSLVAGTNTELWLYLVRRCLQLDPEGDTIGFVFGIQRTEEIRQLTGDDQLINHALLVPGLGAQGGDIASAQMFVDATNGRVLFPSSRALTFPEGIESADCADGVVNCISTAIDSFAGNLQS